MIEWQLSGVVLNGMELVFLLPRDVVLKSDESLKLESHAGDANQTYATSARPKGKLHLDVGTQAEMPVIIKAYLRFPPRLSWRRLTSPYSPEQQSTRKAVAWKAWLEK